MKKDLLVKSLVFFNFLALLTTDLTLAKENQEEIKEVVVTGTRTESKAENLPVTVHIVEKKEIEKQPTYFIQNLGELIKDLPGVHVGQYFPWGPSWIHLRGTGYFIGRTLYLVDSIPVTPFLSTPVHPNDIERIEVLLGPSSALYGPNAMGGVVNIITKKGTKDTGIKLDLGYGSRNTFRPHIEIGNEFKNFHYYISYSGDFSDGYKMNPFNVVWTLYQAGKTGWLSYASLRDNHYRQNFFNTKVGYDDKKGTGAWIGYHYQGLYLYGGRPNRVWIDDGEEGVLNLRLYTTLFDKVKLTGYLGYQHLNRPGKEDRGPQLVNGTLRWDKTPFTRSEWKQERFPLELQADLTFLKNHLTTLGLSWLRDREERKTISEATGRATSESKYTTDQTSFYLQDQWFLLNEKLIFLAGLRYDHWRYHNIFDLISTPQRPKSITKEKTTYRGGVRYKFSEKVSFKASAGTGFWPGLPIWFFQNVRSGKTWREANPNLKPEKTWMIDFGIELNLKKWDTFLSITPYYGKIKDTVSYRYDPHPTLPGVNIVRTENLGGAKIYGVEFMIKKALGKGLNLFGSLTLNRARITDDPTREGNQLRNSPDYWGSVGLVYDNPRWFNAYISYRFSGSRFYDDDNTKLPYYHMDSYQVLNAKVWKDFKLSPNLLMTLSLSVDNLFDRKYETEFIWIHPGRSIQANLQLRYLFNPITK
ncbi:MAG: TonB-dependent receptor [Thermodesulfobacteriaceae bacterium]|nr:TonB-dependent receptor [Thermodesulfobacteriaceae bacterium]MCX8041667.1 TonB-dependent receptor [Thermodesulfobacteriaceae bacterium]MDW8135319.1 TonB-dependent receptor [Thermodesulfobacterium sp.]